MGLGIVGLLLSTEQIRVFLGIPLIEGITENMILIVSLVLLGVGAFLTINTRKSKGPVEVPIYHGKDIVGFRRVHHK